MCVCACICVCGVCEYMYVCVHHMPMGVCVCMSMCLVCACMYVNVCIHHTPMCVCICMCICVCCVCTWVCVWVHTLHACVSVCNCCFHFIVLNESTMKVNDIYWWVATRALEMLSFKVLTEGQDVLAGLGVALGHTEKSSGLEETGFQPSSGWLVVKPEARPAEFHLLICETQQPNSMMSSSWPHYSKVLISTPYFNSHICDGLETCPLNPLERLFWGIYQESDTVWPFFFFFLTE